MPALWYIDIVGTSDKQWRRGNVEASDTMVQQS